MIVISLSFFVVASTASPSRPWPASTRTSGTRALVLLLLWSLVSQSKDACDEGSAAAGQVVRCLVFFITLPVQGKRRPRRGEVCCPAASP